MMEESNKWMVCVLCTTYNQAPYIEDALNGFTMQETTFPYVCCIVDDASTDGEPEVIDKYMKEHFDLDDASTVCREETDDYNLLFARHRTNCNCYFAVLFLKYNHYGSYEKKQRKLSYISKWKGNAKYIAICEGDDYWLDSRKLQKQTSVLESHVECSMAVCNFYAFYEKNGLFRLVNPVPIGASRYLTMSEVLQERGGLIPTASMFCRKELLENKPKEFSTPYVGDRPLRMWCAVNGPIYYDVKPMTVYRVGSVGSFGQRIHGNNQYALDVLKTMCAFFDYFDSYTKFEYHEDVIYMKNREEFSYYKRTSDSKLFRCDYFRSFTLKKKIKIFLKYYTIKFVPTIIYKCLVKIKNSARLYDKNRLCKKNQIANNL